MAAEYSLVRVPPARQRDIFARLVPESGHALFEMLPWWMDWHAGSHVSSHRVQIPLLVLSGDDDRVNPAATGSSEEHTSELQSLMRNSYAVFCLKIHNHRNPDTNELTSK